MELSVVTPVYSEEESLVELVNYCHNNILDHLFEIIIIYHPNSSKKCLKIINELETEFDRVVAKPQNLNVNGGNGCAYIQGFNLVRGSHILMIDSDGEMDANTIPLLIKSLNENSYDIVIGSRFVKGGGFVGYPLHKYILNVSFQLMFRILYNTHIKDLTCGFKIFTREVLDRYNFEAKFQDIGAETTLKPLKGGYIISEIGTIWTGKKGRKNSLSVLGNLRYLFLALKILFRG